MRITRKLILLMTVIAATFIMCGCNPQLSLNPKYTYTEFDMNLGEEIPTDIEEYVDFSGYSEEEARFVRENTEILFDGKKADGTAHVEPGDHTIEINYCGNRYRTYTITIKDIEPPAFDKTENLYTFVGLELEDYLLDSVFAASDNSGDCTVDVKESDVDYYKAGEYMLRATAVDGSGNKSTAKAKVIVQEPVYGAEGTYVYVSIGEQTLTYFVDGEVVLQTPVVTGNAGLHDTPQGTFRLLNKATSIKLVGREDNGDKYESFVNYWMAFLGSSFGLHDATWRSEFGGNIYMGAGSHGCVNMPYDMAAQLFEMIELGTPVIVN